MVVKQIERGAVASTEEELPVLKALSALVRNADAGELMVSGAAGEPIALPASAVQLLRLGVEPLVDRRQVEIHALPVDIAVEEAAKQLGFSIGQLTGMLERGHIAVESAEGKPLIAYDDFLVLKRRREAIRFLSEQGQELEHLLVDVDVTKLERLPVEPRDS